MVHTKRRFGKSVRRFDQGAGGSRSCDALLLAPPKVEAGSDGAMRVSLIQIKSVAAGEWNPRGRLRVSPRMITPALQTGFGDKFFCSTCYEELEREQKLVGLVSGTAYDIYHCPRCSIVHWAARPPRLNRLAS